MSARNFRELLEAQCAQGKYVCLGLDSRYAELPASLKKGYDGTPATHPQFLFNVNLVDVTRHVIGVCKFNLHFYLSQGPDGYRALIDSVDYINTVAPHVPVILDYKSGDIGNTNDEIAETAYDIIGADAATYHNYTGREAMRPILKRRNKGAIVLARTSNPGAGEFQDKQVHQASGMLVPLWRDVAESVSDLWDEFGNCGLVFGATYPHELTEGRSMVGDMPLLLPGAGVQGGNVRETVQAGIGQPGVLATINNSRGLIFAKPRDDESYMEATARAVEAMHADIQSALVLAA